MTDDDYDEIVTEFYGIDPATHKVDNVAITRAGKIWHWSSKRGYAFHSMTGSDARAEVIKVFGWVELIELHPRTPNDKRLEILMDLQAKALKPE
jgi:hypothetical protein